jgi:hypothetical protein
MRFGKIKPDSALFNRHSRHTIGVIREQHIQIPRLMLFQLAPIDNDHLAFLAFSASESLRWPIARLGIRRPANPSADDS